MSQDRIFGLQLFTAFLTCIVSLTPVFASTQVPGPRQDHAIALIGGTVHTVAGPPILGGTVLFEDGIVTAVDTDVELPAGTERVDVGHGHIYPGLIAVNTRLGLVEVRSVRATRDYSEIGEINPNVRAETAVNPDSELIPVARGNGITMAHTVPGGGLISGCSALILLDGWTPEDMTLKAPTGLHINWPSMRIDRSPSASKSEKEQKEAIAKRIDKIRDAFAEARAYMRAKEAEGEKGIGYHDTDLRWEAMTPVLRREIPVFVNANGIKQIQAAVSWANSENVKMVLVGGRDAWLVADLLKENDIPVVITGTHRLPSRRWEPHDLVYTIPAKYHEMGIRYCIGGIGDARNVPYNAASASAFGLPRAEAIKAITLYPAQILGVSDRVGSIEKGKDATLIVTDGDPLEIPTNVNMEFIQGRRVDLRSRHTQLYEKYKIKYERIRN